MADISIIAGDSRIINVQAKNEDGTPINLTGATITWKAAAAPYGTALISKAGSITDATGGVFKVTLTPGDTSALVGNFYHSAQITFPDSSVSTLFLGALAISPLTNALSAEMFKARYPEFAPVSDALISLVLGESSSVIGDGWLQRDRAQAQMLLAAHKLAMEGEPQRSKGGGVGGGTISGAVKRMKVGDVEVEYAGVGGAAGITGGYASSVYGQRYLALMRLSFGGVVAV
ncbi:DUF4054 domain-containing protein [Phyllobacterium sp. BT25]|uniref:DUF4054 domain-containing protein n=1 Tax=Phyllobacterium pellucidum TaxID=2740464 RepID=A0A849VT98_9HYPH|nr:DUF4054 domain-containing protein [Phyllobacterium pellucidum]NTS31270.1 DUF4054 domain-containing protein [Phyllobacterium pellucidum]